VGDRKIILSFYTEPTNVKSNQTVLTKLALADQNTKETMKHVTVKMEVSDSASVRCLLSEFFHTRNCNIELNFKPLAGLKYIVIGRQYVLIGRYFLILWYRILLEVISIDNDETDLAQPLKYDLNIPVI
jgi:hypothetical protein